MKIYIVKAPQGDYEEHREPIVKVFADKAKAEEYVKVENDKLPLEQAEKCRYCGETGRGIWKFSCFKPDKYGFCEGGMKYCDIYPLVIEEHEVQE